MPGSPTAAVWPTTSPTSSCGLWPARPRSRLSSTRHPTTCWVTASTPTTSRSCPPSRTRPRLGRGTTTPTTALALRSDVVGAVGGALPAGPLRLRRPLVAAVVAAVMGMLLGRFVFAGSGDAPSSVARQPKVKSMEQLQEEIRVGGETGPLLTDLGVAYLNQARATADPTWYAKAGTALERAQALSPEEPRTLTGAGLLALARHQFASALALGQRAHRVEPSSPDALGVMVDAQVELGRYDDAAATVQEMVDRRPALASLSRVSYVRELHGDTSGAL